MPVVAESVVRYLTREQRADLIEELTAEMKIAAKDLEFERAAHLRDEIERLKNMK
jgi:excinuclease ABC subunit B